MTTEKLLKVCDYGGGRPNEKISFDDCIIIDPARFIRESAAIGGEEWTETVKLPDNRTAERIYRFTFREVNRVLRKYDDDYPWDYEHCTSLVLDDEVIK